VSLQGLKTAPAEKKTWRKARKRSKNVVPNGQLTSSPGFSAACKAPEVRLFLIRLENVPQWLKPNCEHGIFGTAEALPFVQGLLPLA
jgi:hypothetical protein